MKQKLQYLILSIGLLPILSFAQCFSAVSCGRYHVIGKKTDGTLWVWGADSSGQLANPDNLDQYSPVLLSVETNWQAIKASNFNTFVIKANGTLWGCGGNTYGGLGIGSTINPVSSLIQIGTDSNWKEIAPANYFTIAIKTNNTLWAWGQNVYNQVGDGSGIQRNSPVQIGATADWKTIASSNSAASFAIKTDGTLWGWGSNSSSFFGYSNISEWPVPTQYNSDTDWDKVVMGVGHVLVLKNNGTLWAWGIGSTGETGQDPSTFFGPEPFQIPGTWKAMGAGRKFSIGIKTDGTLWRWGRNDIGDTSGDISNYTYELIQIGSGTNWESVTCGEYNAIGLRSDGSIWAWGANNHGQLGNGTTTPQAEPTQVPVEGCNLSAGAFENGLQFVVSPSPVAQTVTISYKGSQAVDTIDVYDISGKEVYRIEAMGNAAFSSSFSLATLAAGSYVMVLTNGGKKVASKQFIKE